MVSLGLLTLTKAINCERGKQVECIFHTILKTRRPWDTDPSHHALASNATLWFILNVVQPIQWDHIHLMLLQSGKDPNNVCT